MGAVQDLVYYCCVSKGNKIFYAHSGGDCELESLAALCLEKTPPLHMWYFETIRKRTFGFLVKDSYVYFAIANEGLGNSRVLRFLEHLKYGFEKVTKIRSKCSLTCPSPVCLQEQLVPVIRSLISSLENVSQLEVVDQMAERPPDNPVLSPFNNHNAETATSKVPLLGKPNRHEKKKMKDWLAEARDIASEDHGKSMDRGIQIDIPPESNKGGVSSILLQKSLSSTRIRGQQFTRKMCWRQIWIVLLIDVSVCLALFGIWLGICRGFQCLSS